MEGSDIIIENNIEPAKKLLNLDLPYKYLSYCYSQKKIDENKISPTVILDRLKTIIKEHHKIFDSSKTLVMVIDEFNLVKTCQSEEGLIKAMLNHLIYYSKDEPKVQVILGTTDPFIPNYLESLLHIHYWDYDLWELDWISHDETLKYLDYKKVPKEFQEKIYYYFGGDIIRINSLLSCCKDGDELKVSDQKIENSANYKIMSFKLWISQKISELSSQEKEILLTIFKRLVDQGMLDYFELVDEFPIEIIQKFLSLNLFYLNMGMPLADFFEGHNADMLTWNLPIQKFAVKSYLEK